MTNSQRLAVQISETRQQLAGAIEERNKLPNDKEPAADLVSRMDKLSKDIQRLEVEYRAAIVTEDAEAEETTEERTEDAEGTERAKLLAESSIVPFIMEASEGKPVDGREAECRAAVLGDDARAGLVPLDLLLPAAGQPDIETRAAGDAVTPVAREALADGSQAAVLPRVFSRSIAARLGVSMPSVPVGAAVYPIMTSGTSAAMAADAVNVPATAGAFTGFTLEPTRLTAAYLFNARQTLQLRNFEAVLRRDLSAVMSDAMDNQIINGDGTGVNVNGFLSELAAATVPAEATDWSQYLGEFTGLVDGINAYGLMDIRAVVGKLTFGYAHTLFRTGATDNGPRASAYEYVRERIGGMSVSSRIPEAEAGKTQVNIAALTSYPGRNAVAPVWRAMELIRDPYTDAGKGQVRITAVMFWNFKVLREEGWKLWPVRAAK